jgi:uncharacterized protein YeaO (DUF488 family)
MVKTKRVYDAALPDDGKRILVDRLWPRGMKKERARIEEWLKDIAPSDELRKWFSHDPAKWPEFKKKYNAELKKKSELVERLKTAAKKGTITLLFASKELKYNNATVIKEIIEH